MKDIPRLQQIVNVALCNGASIREIVNKLEDAHEDAYCPRGYGASDLDIVTLVFWLGSSQLLFALNHSLGLPSICTLRTRSTFTKLTLTIGPIRNKQLDEIFILLCSMSLMIDEIALEEMAVHFSKYNKVVGLCWKHSRLVNPVLRTYKSAVTITQKIHDSEVHLGKELTVIGVACFGEDKLYPILVAPKCKIEGAGDMEATVRPLWSFANDSDATQCAACHRLFLKTPLSTNSQLYGVLSNMPGLNTLTGDGKVTLNFDFKHIFQCILCTLIRSPTGIVLNNGCVINTMMLSRYLVWLPAYDEASIMKLLHPNDPQDVPRAIELMQTIHTILNNSFSTDIDTHADLVSITLLSNIIESILVPFINPNLSLTEQVHYLSRYAHLTFTIFRVHQHSFMPFQLYYNTQTAIKNIIFTITKQQVLDLYTSFFLGCSYAQAIDRLGAAKDIDGHLSLSKWIGDIISGRCDLPSVWQHGHEMAVTILTSSQINHINYSYTELSCDPRTDMICYYFGITDEEREDSS
ncbi:hypothetical protein DEU56DRAFT_873149 [Suillus clintonianus]|uniref:uncharacterized protein n=1 Tax=Suillus clintonianus TaxID=1904413 RepID=UPI001B87DB18|nr:uncharacterized protein DEU56DRAFT_873149 [Suillus clintonianus]KAG2125172.1 hypothetical protein DEU56DRAFT_873149 [Suillus clintonianus]